MKRFMAAALAALLAGFSPDPAAFAAAVQASAGTAAGAAWGPAAVPALAGEPPVLSPGPGLAAGLPAAGILVPAALPGPEMFSPQPAAVSLPPPLLPVVPALSVSPPMEAQPRAPIAPSIDLENPGGERSALPPLEEVRSLAAPEVEKVAGGAGSSSELYASGLSLEDALAGRRGPIRSEEAPEPVRIELAGHHQTLPARLVGPAAAPAAAVPLFGAASATLAPWPSLALAAGVVALLALVLAYDVATRGGLSVWLSAPWRSVRERRLARDLPLQLGLREADRPALSAFIRDWLRAPSSSKKALLEAAEADEGLWREKLAAAAYAETDAQWRTLLRERLQALSRQRLTPLESLLDRLPETPAPKRGAGPVRRTAALALAAAAAVFLALGAVGLERSAQLERERARADRAATDIFYGEDAYLLRRTYRDPKLDGVLKAMGRWNDPSPSAARALEEAVRDLRSSSDPASDPLLDALFRRAPLLPLSRAAHEELLTALMERDRQAVWDLFAAAAGRQGDPASTELLLRLIAIADRADTDKSFNAVFVLLKSPNGAVRARAEAAVEASLARKEGEAGFLTRLEGAGKRHAADPDLQLWVERLLLRRLGRPGAEDFPFVRMEPIFSRALTAQGPGGRPRAAAVLEETIKGAPRPSQGRVADPLAYAGRYLIDGLASGQIKQASAPDSLLGRLRGMGSWLMGSEVPRPVAQSTYLLSDLERLGKGAQGADAELYRTLARVAGQLGVPASREEPEVAAAREVNEKLFDAVLVFRSRFGLWEALRREGFALKVNSMLDKDRALRWRYSPADRERLARFLEEVALSGRASDSRGTEVPMIWTEKAYLAQAAAAARGDAWVADGPAALEKAFLAQRVPDFALHRLRAALAKGPASGVPSQVWALRFLSGRLTAGTALDPEGVYEALNEAFGKAVSARGDEAWEALLGGLEPGRAVPAPVTRTAQAHLDREVHALVVRVRISLHDKPGAPAYDKGLKAGGLLPGGLDRLSFRLQHIRRLKALVPEVGGPADVAPRLDTLLKFGAKAGIPDGQKPGEIVADELAPMLEDMTVHFPRMDINQALYNSGLALRVPAEPSEREEWDFSGVYPGEYSSAQLGKLIEVLEAALKRGTTLDPYGKTVAMSTGQKAMLIRVSDRAEELWAKHFPKDRSARPTLGDLLAATASSDAKARAAAEAALLARLLAPGGEGALLARLEAALAAHPRAPELELWSLNFLSRRLGGPQGAELKDAGAEFKVRDLLYWLRVQGRESDAWAVMEKAVANLPAGSGGLLRQRVLIEIRDIAWTMTTNARVDFYGTDLGKRLEGLGLPNPPSGLPPYRQRDLAALRKLLLEWIPEWEKTHTLDKSQRELKARAQLLERLERLGAQVGMPK